MFFSHSDWLLKLGIGRCLWKGSISKMHSLFCAVTAEDILAIYEAAVPISHVFLLLPSGTRALNTNLHLSSSAPLS